MKATEIKKGAQLENEGTLVYTVLDVWDQNTEIVARVRFAADGGTGTRRWDREQEVPLTPVSAKG